jgi:hypothetical protein
MHVKRVLHFAQMDSVNAVGTLMGIAIRFAQIRPRWRL